jgi:hypothetical protein
VITASWLACFLNTVPYLSHSLSVPVTAVATLFLHKPNLLLSDCVV